MDEVIIGEKYGCLEVMDDGSEFLELINSKIQRIEAEKQDFLTAIENNELKYDNKKIVFSWGGMLGQEESSDKEQYFDYKPINFESSDSVCAKDFDKAIETLLKEKEIKHYKCKCKKCGKIRYSTPKALSSNPSFCLKPLYCSNGYIRGGRAIEANKRKREQYKNNSSIQLVYDKREVMPSSEYCSKWNEKRTKELKKKSDEYVAMIAALPRVPCKNYDKDYVGKTFESFKIIECINDRLESEPTRIRKRYERKWTYEDITVFKEYNCKCYLCGKERNITCDRFNIKNIPYIGYCGEVYCDCHPLSSFQWIVNKLLIENDVNYQVEYSFQDLYGYYGKNLLSFDFAIFNEDGSIKCLIECQGEQHYEPVEEFGGKNGYEKQVRNDNLKREYVQKNNIPLIEISYKDKQYEKIESILKENGII